MRSNPINSDSIPRSARFQSHFPVLDYNSQKKMSEEKTGTSDQPQNPQNGNDEPLECKLQDLQLTRIQDLQKILTLEKELKSVTEDKINLMKAKSKLEEEVAELKRTQNLADTQEVQTMQFKSEELLLKAKGMLFEKTKLCQNQELQIEALTQQVKSLKEVVSITKDLLEIRNMEVRHLQDKLQTMDEKIGIERQKHDLMNQKMDRMLEMNTELKREYETQLVLFNALRERYSERELARGVLDDLRNNAEQQAGNNDREGNIAAVRHIDEGERRNADEVRSNVEGERSKAEGEGSKIEGEGNKTEGEGSKTEGEGNKTEGEGSKAEGEGSKTGEGNKTEKTGNSPGGNEETNK